MKPIALFADIHANLEAFEICLAHARAQGVTQFAFLGDMIGYGADPVPVLEAVMDLATQGHPVLLGNHDQTAFVDPKGFNEYAKAAALWTRAQLAPRHIEFLRQLPLKIEWGEGDTPDVLLVHASAQEPQQWLYVHDGANAAQSLRTAPSVRFIFGGHVHQPCLYYTTQAGAAQKFHPTAAQTVPLSLGLQPLQPRRWLATIGSVGQPRDRNNAATYAIFDRATPAITFYRLPYDHQTTARKIVAAGLPPWLAERLSAGV